MEDNIKMDMKGVQSENVEGMRLTEVRIKLRDFVVVVMNVQVL
jgi:hypothetical protein